MVARMARHAVEGLPQRLHARREALGLSQAEVAKRMGGDATDVQVSHYERGRRSPAAAALRDLARALECSADHLLGMDAPEPTVIPSGRTLEQMIEHAEAKRHTYFEMDGRGYTKRKGAWVPVI